MGAGLEGSRMRNRNILPSESDMVEVATSPLITCPSMIVLYELMTRERLSLACRMSPRVEKRLLIPGPDNSPSTHKSNSWVVLVN